MNTLKIQKRKRLIIIKMNNIYRCIIADNNPKNTEIIYYENTRVIIIFWKLSSYLGSLIYDVIMGGDYTSPKPSIDLVNLVTHQPTQFLERLHMPDMLEPRI